MIGVLTVFKGQLQVNVDTVEDVEPLSEMTAFDKQVSNWKKEYPAKKYEKKEIVFKSNRIGVISTGEKDAGYTDFASRLNQYLQNGNVSFVKRFSRLTAKNIVSFLNELDKMELDVIVIVRGGGSKYDFLELYNPLLIQGMVKTKTPIAIGIGHKIDNFPCDDYADLKAITPTAIGSSISRILRKNEIKSDNELKRNKLMKELLRYKEKANYLSEENERLKEKIKKLETKKGFLSRLFGLK